MNEAKEQWAYISQSREVHVIEKKLDSLASYGEGTIELPKFVPFYGLARGGYPILNGNDAIITIEKDGTISRGEQHAMALAQLVHDLKEANGIK